jgi:hypothetical protein
VVPGALVELLDGLAVPVVALGGLLDGLAVPVAARAELRGAGPVQRAAALADVPAFQDGASERAAALADVPAAADVLAEQCEAAARQPEFPDASVVPAAALPAVRASAELAAIRVADQA